MVFYPILLQMKDRSAVVIGGGKVAERKIAGLAAAQARVTVISPTVTNRIKEMADQGDLIWINQQYSADLIHQATLLVAATDDASVNKAVYHDATPHQLINIADHPELSNFHVPSVIRRGRLVITVSTGGASPILAKKIKTQIADLFDASYEEYVEFLFEARKSVLKEVTDTEKKQVLLTEITAPSFLASDDRWHDFEKLKAMVLKA